MAEVGESKTEIRAVKLLELERVRNEKGTQVRTKKVGCMTVG